MPRPADSSHRYLPGLDGLRALAVVAVILYHLGVPWAPGGLIGVGVFFTLSGYLITDLLVGRWDTQDGLGLGDFWLRRARRLLPALVLVLVAVTAWVALAQPSQLQTIGGQDFAAAVYVSNWWLIFHHVSYFAQFGPPSPFGHLWSLAVEEQFYLVWPWLLLIGLRFVPERRGVWRVRGRPRLAALTLVAAAASAVTMVLLYHPGGDPTRVYDGTDTRAFGLLIGAALALWWPSRRTSSREDSVRRVADLLGVVGLAGIVAMVVLTNQYSSFLYRGGLVLLAVATALVVRAVISRDSWVGRLLGLRPLRWVGERSYGIYLWHYPVIVLTTPASQHGFVAWRASLQVAASVVLAAASWRWVEQPIRTGRFGRRPDAWVASGYGQLAHRWGWVGSVGCLIALVPAGLFLDATSPVASASPALFRGGVTATVTAPAAPTTTSVPAAQHMIRPHVVPGLVPGSGDGAASPTTTSTTLPAAGRSSCTSVAHLGDSTSESLVSSNYLPDPAQQLPAQYEDVGVRTVHLAIYGGTSVVEHLTGEPNGYQAAQQLVSGGYHGCWVIALGTNDAADIGSGSTIGATQRISQMMQAIGNQPVMWVEPVSLLSSGPYAESNMSAFARALAASCAKYPNLRVYNWPAAAQPGWFISDGIHYSSLGSAYRAHDIAQALAAAFPSGHPSPAGCVVS